MAAAEDGKYALLSEATGGESINNYTFANVPLDTVEHEDSDEADATAGAGDISLKVNGHWLVGHYLGFNRTSPSVGWAQWESALRLNGVDLEYGRSSGTAISSVGASEAHPCAMTVVNVASQPETLRMRGRKTDSNTAPGGMLIERRPGAVLASGMFALKLNDDFSYARLRNTATTPTSSTTWASISWGTQDELDTADFTHSTSTNPAQITFDSTGKYLVMVNVHVEDTGLADVTAQIRLVTGTSTVTEIKPTKMSRWIPAATDTTAAVDKHHLNLMILVDNASASTVYQVQFRELAASGAFQVQSTDTTFVAVKLRDDIDYCRVIDAAGGQSLDTNADLSFDTATEEDTGTFNHNPTTTDDTEVRVATAGPYLACFQVVGSGGGANLLTTRLNIRVNQSSPPFSGAAMTMWNNGSDSDECGVSGCSLFEASANDDVSVFNVEGSTNSDAGATVDANGAGLQLIPVWALLPSVKSGDDTVDITDEGVRAIDFNRTTDDTVAVTDEVVRALAMSRHVADTVAIVDEAVRALAMSRAADDETVAITDEAARALAMSRATDDAVALLDEVERSLGLLRATDDTVAITDEAARALAINRAVESTVALSDEAVQLLTAVGNVLLKAVDDTVAISDETAAARALNRATADELAVLDEAVRSGLALLRATSETVEITDEAFGGFRLLQAVGDQLAILDEVVQFIPIASMLGSPRGDSLVAGPVAMDSAQSGLLRSQP